MPIVAADWSVDNATGNIRYIGNDHGGGAPSYATVIELHRWLQDLADDASFAGNDELDITVLNPSERATNQIITLLNGFNIDDNAAEHLYAGSIIQGGGAVVYDGLNVIGASTNIQIIQGGAVVVSTGSGLSPEQDALLTRLLDLAEADEELTETMATLRKRGTAAVLLQKNVTGGTITPVELTE